MVSGWWKDPRIWWEILSLTQQKNWIVGCKHFACFWICWIYGRHLEVGVYVTLKFLTYIYILFVEHYQLDMLLHSEWVLFEWHVWIRRGNKDTKKEEHANTETRVHANTHYCQWVVFGWFGCTGRGWQGSSASSTQPPTHTPAATPTPDPPRQYPRYLRYLTIPIPQIYLSNIPDIWYI